MKAFHKDALLQIKPVPKCSSSAQLKEDISLLTVILALQLGCEDKEASCPPEFLVPQEAGISNGCNW